MAFNGVSLLLLLACCVVPTIARNLDISQRSNREFSNSEEDTKARSAGILKQGPRSSFAETGHILSVLYHETGHILSVLYHETGHEENPFFHGTGHEENSIIKSALHPKPELSLHDTLPSMSLPSLSHAEDESELVLHDDDTIPSLLDQNGLPIGLLPSSVASYSVTDGGEFTVSLQKACYVKFDYEVYYAQTITGKLSYGTITDLSGIQAKEAFFWVPVTGIRADIPSSEYIYFDVGPISKKLSISQFQTIPVCKVKAMAFSALA